MRFKTLFAVAVAAAAVAVPAAATPINTSPITADYYVEHHGLYWAWASPVAIENGRRNVLYRPEIQDGWRYATDEEFADFPALYLFGSADNPRCASQFWNSFYDHCDWRDLAGGFITNVITNTLSDIFYVKDVGVIATPVPEPASFGLVGLGLAAGGLAMRRRSKKAD